MPLPYALRVGFAKRGVPQSHDFLNRGTLTKQARTLRSGPSVVPYDARINA
jgi:hypothetical protein